MSAITGKEEMKKRILIVDDEPLLLEALQREMREFSNEYQVIVTADCTAIAAIVADQKVDVLITDILMPEKDGIQIITEMQERYPEIKIITMSGGGKIDAATYLRMAEGLGASCSLQKPFTRADLLTAIRAVLAQSQEERQSA